jgi:cytosine/adenosine deaminase-related metal-dependent hydrolase
VCQPAARDVSSGPGNLQQHRCIALLYGIPLLNLFTFCSGPLASDKAQIAKAGGKFTLYQAIILYRKFKADHFFNGYNFVQGKPVLITGERGRVENIVEEADAGDGIETLEGTLTPGFINAHCHLELSHLRGLLPSGTGLIDFVQQVMSRRNNYNELKEAAMVAADIELFNGGVVAVGDICNTADSISAKNKSSLYWHNFIEVSGFTESAAAKRLDDMTVVLAAFNDAGLGANTSFSPHAPYSVSGKLFKLLNDATAGQLVTIHNQESRAENELYQQGTGTFLDLYRHFGIDYSAFVPSGESSFKTWLPLFNKRQSVISVHNTFTDTTDLQLLKGRMPPRKLPVHFCICIRANQFIEQADPPIELLRQHHCNLVLGTDSYASNWSLSILDEIKTILRATKGAVPEVELLQWATINGARALRADASFGSFEKGKIPGVVLIQNPQGSIISEASTVQRLL